MEFVVLRDAMITHDTFQELSHVGVSRHFVIYYFINYTQLEMY